MYVEERLVEMCDQCRASAMAAAPNVVVVRARRGRIVRVTIRSVQLDNGKPASSGRGDLKLTYEEVLAGKTVVILKRYDNTTGRFVEWSDSDAFDPRRYNPDQLPHSLMELARQ